MQKLFNLIITTQFGYVYQIMLEMDEATAMKAQDYFERMLRAVDIQHSGGRLVEVDQSQKDQIKFTHHSYPSPTLPGDFVVEYLEGYRGLAGKLEVQE